MLNITTSSPIKFQPNYIYGFYIEVPQTVDINYYVSTCEGERFAVVVFSTTISPTVPPGTLNFTTYASFSGTATWTTWVSARLGFFPGEPNHDFLLPSTLSVRKQPGIGRAQARLKHLRPVQPRCHLHDQCVPIPPLPL